MNDVICFDIETIPKENLNDIEKEEIEKRLQSQISKLPTPPTEEEKISIKNKIMATSPYYGQIICIGLYRNKNGLDGSIAITGEEKDILERFWRNLEDFQGLFVSFNGLEFDIPFIIKRTMHHKIPVTNINFLNLKRFSYYPHFDVRYIMGDFDKYAIGSLKTICNFLNIPSPKEGEVKSENVYEYYKKGEINKIAEYCLKDVISTYKCYEIIKNYIYK